MYYRYKGHGFNIEPKPTSDGKGWTFIANVHWVEGEREECTRYTSDQSFTSSEEAQMEGIAETRKWIDSGKPCSLP
jgi:hypothetical protein